MLPGAFGYQQDAGGGQGFLQRLAPVGQVPEAIAIPVFLAQRERAFEAECRSDTRNAAAAATLYFAANNTYVGMDNAALQANGFNPSPGTVVTVDAGADANSYSLTTNCENIANNVTYDSDDGTVVGP